MLRVTTLIHRSLTACGLRKYGQESADTLALSRALPSQPKEKPPSVRGSKAIFHPFRIRPLSAYRVLCKNIGDVLSFSLPFAVSFF